MGTVKTFTSAIVLSLAAGSSVAASTTEILRDMTSTLCAPQGRDASAQTARGNIERHVTRAEASIKPPIPIGDLSCLNDLMNFDLSVLSNGMFNLEGLFNGLTAGLNPTSLMDAAGNQISRQICDFANQKWQDLTKPLSLNTAGLNSMIGGATGGLSGWGSNMNFGSVNLGSSPGGSFGGTPTSGGNSTGGSSSSGSGNLYNGQ